MAGSPLANTWLRSINVILESITEPTATITLTITELKRISDGHGWAMECLANRAIDTDALSDFYKEHKRLQACVDSVIRAMEE